MEDPATGLSGAALEDKALLYAMGELPAEELAQVERWLAGSATEAERGVFRDACESAAAVALALDPIAPPASLKNRLMQSVDEPKVVLDGEGDWEETGVPGITCKKLYTLPGTSIETMLMKLAAGSSFPPHMHLETEQCLVLEGEIRMKNGLYHKGDFLVFEQGTLHPEFGSDQGGTVLIMAGPVEIQRKRRNPNRR